MKNYICAWIVGASGGIGSSAIKTISTISNMVCLFDSSKIKLKYKNRFWLANFSIEKEVEESTKNAYNKMGPPEALLVTVGQVISKDFVSTSNSEIVSLFNNNYLTVINSLKFFLKYCKKSSKIEKSIVIISSNASFEARPNQVIYASLKASINSLVKSLAKDWGKFNIRINAIAPGTIIVPRNSEHLKLKFPNFPYDFDRPISKLAYPEDLKSSILYLFTKKNPITGQIISVDGGSTL